MNLRSVRELPIAAPLWSRLARLHDNHKRIAASALLIGVLTVVAKLFVAGREIAIAWRYGVSGTVDAYQLAITIVTWLPMMLISVMTVVFVPRLVALRSGSFERRRFISELNGTILAVSVALAVFLWAAAPLAARLFASHLEPATLDLTTDMCRMMSPVACFFVWSGYFQARLQARERFAYTVTEAVPAVIIAAAVFSPVLLPPQARLGWATSAGYALQVLALVVMVTQADRPIGGFALRHTAPEWSALYRDLGVMAIGQIVISLGLPIDQAFAARIGPGSVATLGYANRIIILMTGLGAVVFTRAFLPIFSSEIVEGSKEAAARHANQWAILLMIAGLIVVAATWALAPWGVSIVFQRGAFGASDSAAVAHVLRFGIIQVPFVFAGLALVQWLAAKGSYVSLMWISCGALAVKVVMNLLLVRSFGLAGLMSASAAMYGFSFACTYVLNRRATLGGGTGS
jgi:peptidoglycan biosynthesis protein MviN/MurJ (putative lipid II flippase)